jgi:hypothetical protein
MAINPVLVQFGSVGGSPINCDLSRLEDGFTVRVLLTSDYTTLRPAGLPTRPSMTGTSVDRMDFPQTIPNGTILTVFTAEADALIAAGAAVVVGGAVKVLQTEAGLTLMSEAGVAIQTE